LAHSLKIFHSSFLLRAYLCVRPLFRWPNRFVLLLCLLSACSSPAPVLSTLPATLPPTTQAAPTNPVVPSPFPSPSAAPTASPTPQPYSNLCSPLEGETLAALASPDLLKNPFLAPRTGYDDGHQGVDFAYWSRPDGKPMLGLPVQSVLDSRVAAALDNHQPYGNALILETPLDQLPPSWLARLPISTFDPSAALHPSVSLRCPAYDYHPNSTGLSLYLLYAHLNLPVTQKIGQSVSCGETIGQVGTTGNSVNPHLHLETRVGLSGATFSSMDHYESSATDEQMRNYCLWRISGAFQPFDPMTLLTQPTIP
jgi:murein DD-endopeptidase MepM/ murein hydrolase activator NlpD